MTSSRWNRAHRVVLTAAVSCKGWAARP
jgi:hypothetical protein